MAANFPQTLIPLLCSITLLLALATTSARAQGETTSFTYDFYGETPTDLIYDGDAHFPSDSTYLRMTKTDNSGKALPHSAGRVVYSKPFKFWEKGAMVDLETTMKFIIKPNSGDTNPADGFTFFIQPVGTPIGYDGASLGIFDKSGKRPSVFAIEFDIFLNDGVDPSYRHVGIDIESNDSIKTKDVGDALIGQEVTARINYEEATKVIDVHVTAGSKTYEVSYVYDLSTVLQQEVQVGISAATGVQVAVHDLISWYFTATLVHDNKAEEDVGIRQYV